MIATDSPVSKARGGGESPSHWRRHFTRQRLRLFLVLSIAAHLLLGLSWGVPAYLKGKRVDADMRQQQALRDQQHREAEEAQKLAKAKNLQQTAHDVAEQTHKQFDAITADMKQAEKEEAEKKDDDVDTTTGPITAATVSGVTIGM